MEQRLDMVLAPERYEMKVSEVCQMWGVSRQTFYEWRRRYEDEGLSGLENRSSRPRAPAGQIPRDMERRIVEMRRDHRRWGARRIRAELRRKGLAAPARSTIERVLVRNGLLPPVKPPTPPPQRFVRERPNELWQLDAKEWALVDGSLVQIFSCIDDCSRYCGATRAFAELSSAAAIATFDDAVAELGLPEATLADRGNVFTGRTTRSVAAFERHVWSYGVYSINGRPYHPQTQGKVERFHRTLIEWLEDNGPYCTLEDLNLSLIAFRHHYNHDRPNQALDDATPAEVRARLPHAGPDPALAAKRCRRESLRTTKANGTIEYASWTINLGVQWARTKVRIVDFGHTIEIRDSAGDLIREVKPDLTRTYLGNGRPKGRHKL